MTEKEDIDESVRRHYVNFIKKHIEPLPSDTLHMIFTQAVFQMCYESFLQEVEKNHWEEKVATDKFHNYDRKLKGRFSFYMLEACKEIIEYREKLSEEMRKGSE
jgi:hypothetical protein